jgi:hypothetical protein
MRRYSRFFRTFSGRRGLFGHYETTACTRFFERELDCGFGRRFHRSMKPVCQRCMFGKLL